jgi:Na+-driven multidrug efflux pump
MRIVGLALFIGAGMSGMGAAFTGAGKNRPMLYASVLGQWGVLVPWALVATLLLKAPILWLWLAILAGDGAEMLFRWYLYKKTRWATTEV